jgi:hypothetical protein
MIVESTGSASGAGTAQGVSATVPLEKIKSGVKPVEAKRNKDARDKQEEAAYTAERHRAETASIREANRDLRVNRLMRNRYAQAVFWYLVWYSVFAAFVVALSGWKIWGFVLPDIVLTALVGSTAASAIGLVGIVVTGLFRGVSTSKKDR